MKLEFPSRGVAILAIRERIGCINASGLTTKRSDQSPPCPCRWGFGTDADNRDSQSECTEEQENAPAAGESGNQRPKRRKDKNGRPVLSER